MPVPDQSAFISCDLALFIRLLEVAREDIKSDADLHVLVEQVSAAQATKGEALTMEDYEGIVDGAFAPASSKFFTEDEVRARGLQAMRAAVEANAQARLQAFASNLEQAEDPLEVQVTIGGERSCVVRALASLYLLYRNGAVGHSGIFGAYWDGDGSDKIDLTGVPPELDKEFSTLAEALSSYGGTAELVSTADGELSGFVLSNDPAGGHYCKHKKVFPAAAQEVQSATLMQLQQQLERLAESMDTDLDRGISPSKADYAERDRLRREIEKQTKENQTGSK